MTPRCSISLRLLPAPATVAVLSACGGGGTPDSPFIRRLQLGGEDLHGLVAVRYTIAAKPGASSKPVSVRYTAAALERRGDLSADRRTLSLPVFGLYAGRLNHVSVELQFEAAPARTVPVDLATNPYVDGSGIYDRPTILQRRAAGTPLGFEYLYVKSGLGSPIVIDTDGEVRWVGAGVASGFSSAFRDNGFFVGDPKSPKLTRLELDGSSSEASLASATYTGFHHNIDPGKEGLLVEVDAASDGVASLESIVAEVSGAGAVLGEWDFAAILGAYMAGEGDDPSAFVRPGVDWFHMNSAIYDARDDSLIVSSRENFVIKVDYQTRDIVWILGDPTKHWYGFPSLRAKALTLEQGGLYPIGQHALSITSDGQLLLFNDGLASRNQPAEAPAGENRTYSAVSAYAIDPEALTAREVWRFDHDQTILSSICSSAYEAAEGSLLVNYAVADDWTKARLVGLDAAHEVVFDFEYPTHVCDTSWNAAPIPFDDLRFE